MWKYIITFCLLTWEQIPCPEGKVGCLVLHEKMIIDCWHHKFYNNRDSAFIEFKRLNEPFSNADSVRIDSIKWK